MLTERPIARLTPPATLALAMTLLLVNPAFAQDRAPGRNPSQEECLNCHGDPQLATTLESGEALPLYISAEVFADSIHGLVGLECKACHGETPEVAHVAAPFVDRRQLSRHLYQTCSKCHADNYEKTLDSMHAQAAADGNLQAPICTDCHGAHDTLQPDQPRARISQTCGQCHTSIFEEYRESVHGDALIQQDNPDVPVCTDCHGVHNIHDPRTAQFRVASPELCAGCHADAQLMAKYGLSADVYNLYSLSWHGVDLTVYRANWPTIWHERAVCTDCHGVHDIRRTADSASRVNPANLLSTCQQCHPAAGPNWTGAWTGHNRISIERTPFLFYTEAFYKSFTPAVLWISGAYVVLQIVRGLVGRVRRSLR
ncbi:MAG TPA: cytochrome c3 family protein [Anaerolineales bacterium]|nr:cytochrome c3 family protein [Anaerolineales bacterium]